MALDKKTIEAELTKWKSLMDSAKRGINMLWLALPLVENGTLGGLPIELTAEQKQIILDLYGQVKQTTKDRAAAL